MKASETKIQPILEGTKQYVVPLFQRSYDWNKKEWSVLWNDILELYEMENPRSHFLGSIVTMPTISVPEGVTKYLLIDGQQRLTTLFIILSLLRDKALQQGKSQLSEEIQKTLLTNPYKQGFDYFKLFPTNVDRDIFQRLINKEKIGDSHNILDGYKFFERKLNRGHFDIEKIKNLIINNLIVVSIVLDKDDNPHLVFESLNAKGRPLTQSDLIRNYFLMKFHINNQEDIYLKYWKPMQDALDENLTEFIRHYLMKEGKQVKQNEVYFSLKEEVEENNPLEYLKNLYRYSKYYERLIYPEKEQEPNIRKMLIRLNRLEVTTAYPFLLNIFEEYSKNNINGQIVVEILKILENFIIRRFVCNIPTNQLNKIFPPLYLQAKKMGNDLISNIKNILQGKNYPKDAEFKTRLVDAKLYGSGDRQIKTKLILESIEESYFHKEQVSFDNLSIEHIMPQTLNEWWQNHLGENWEITHELLLHTIGNLTLTAYNPELSNADFETKKQHFINSHLEMNRYFRDTISWKEEDIKRRSQQLAEIAISIWPYFGDENIVQYNENITGTTPQKLYILGQHFEVQSWRDVMEKTINCIIELEPEKFEEIVHQFPRFVGRDKNKFRAVRELSNGAFIEVNLSAKAIYNFCIQVIETLGLTSEDWKVEPS